MKRVEQLTSSHPLVNAGDPRQFLRGSMMASNPVMETGDIEEFCLDVNKDDIVCH